MMKMGLPFEIKLSFLKSIFEFIIKDIYPQDSKAVEFDCYAFRHRCHSDFYLLGCEERTINYLFGHYKNQIYDFTYAFLSDEIIQKYNQITNKIIKDYMLYE